VPAPTLTEVAAAAPPVEDLLVVGDRRWSSGDVTTAAARLAGGLAARGVDPGDAVAFEAPVGPESVLLYRACWHLGAVAVALHPQLGAARVDRVLARLSPAVTIARPRSTVAARPGVLTTSTQGWAALTAGDPVPASPVDGDRPALVLFTSGSTGRPKGVVHTGAGLAVKARQSLEVHDLGPGDAVLMPAPLAHVSGLLHAVLIPAAGGVKAVLMPSWRPEVALDLIEQERISYMVGPPTFFLDLMNHPAFAPARVASLRFLSCGGTGVTPAFVDRAATELGCVVKRSYGSTEAPTVTTSRNDDPVHRRVGTDGRAFGATELRIDGRRPGADGEGELWVRGPEVATGYIDADDTAAAFEDGWFRTGDVGRLEDGWLTITGRVGDRIIRGGENVEAEEVEQVLEAHPRVHQAVAVGVPDERLGEQVGAAVVVDGGFDLDECRRWFAGQDAGRLLVPERLVVLDRIPTLAAGKPDRAALIHQLSRQ
jgi:acyl-CoA synthetase (AMP-forming)/AMP-acid ligase II